MALQLVSSRDDLPAGWKSLRDNAKNPAMSILAGAAERLELSIREVARRSNRTPKNLKDSFAAARPRSDTVKSIADAIGISARSIEHYLEDSDFSPFRNDTVPAASVLLENWSGLDGNVRSLITGQLAKLDLLSREAWQNVLDCYERVGAEGTNATVPPFAEALSQFSRVLEHRKEFRSSLLAIVAKSNDEIATIATATVDGE